MVPITKVYSNSKSETETQTYIYNSYKTGCTQNVKTQYNAANDLTSCGTYKHCDYTASKTKKEEDAISLVLTQVIVGGIISGKVTSGPTGSTNK